MNMAGGEGHGGWLGAGGMIRAVHCRLENIGHASAHVDLEVANFRLPFLPSYLASFTRSLLALPACPKDFMRAMQTFCMAARAGLR